MTYDEYTSHFLGDPNLDGPDYVAFDRSLTVFFMDLQDFRHKDIASLTDSNTI